MEPSFDSQLSKRDYLNLLSLSYKSLTCHKISDIKALISDLNQLFAFDNALCAECNLLQLTNGCNHTPNIDVCNVSYPSCYLEQYFNYQYYYTDSVLFDFFTNMSPVNWQEVYERCDHCLPTLTLAKGFNIHDGWTYGTIDINTMNCTVFFMGGPKIDCSCRNAIILEYIIPFYSQALTRIINNYDTTVRHLTRRQIEILKWIKVGKSSWEVSKILNCSKRNVDFHIGNIKKNLGAVTRAQAVAIALEHGIIKF